MKFLGCNGMPTYTKTDQLTTMSKDDKTSKGGDKVEKKRKKHREDKKRDKSIRSEKKQKVAEAAFSLLADETRIDPTLSSLFAAKVGSCNANVPVSR